MPSYLVQSILVTLFCCLPFGIVAIVYSAQAQSKASAGDIQGGLRASGLARTWCWVSFGVGLGISVIWFLIVLASGDT